MVGVLSKHTGKPVDSMKAKFKVLDSKIFLAILCDHCLGGVLFVTFSGAKKKGDLPNREIKRLLGRSW